MNQITTPQLVAAIVFLVGTIGTLLGVIRSQYAARLEDRDKIIEEQRSRIADYERDRKDRLSAQDKVVSALEVSVEVNRRQGDVLEALAERLSSPKRTTRAGGE